MRNSKFLFLVVIFLLSSRMMQAQTETAINGQISAWLINSPEPVWESQAGIRYIPEFSLNHNLSRGNTLDSELAANIYGTGTFQSRSKSKYKGGIKPYRLWLRFAATKYEIRLGLQKINFGSAVMLRPLMWFDRIDPRDPLQITDGVYALLGRYYFQNNANIWLWGLYGNDDTKGWEIFPTKDKNPEFGGRFQLPVLTGEMAFSYHERVARANGALFGIKTPDFTAQEKRYGLDGKWDAGIGLWFEGNLIYQDLPIPSLTYRRMLTLGADYTFGLGNGLYVQSEYLRIDNSDKPEKLGVPSSLLALSSSYPVGLLDNFRGIVYYDFKNDNWYRFLSWQRTYDNFTFYMMGFWNPEIFNIYQNQSQNTFFAGKGIQLMLVFNH